MWGGYKVEYLACEALSSQGTVFNPWNTFTLNWWRLTYLHRPSPCDHRRIFFLARRIGPGLRWGHRRIWRCRVQFATWVLKSWSEGLSTRNRARSLQLKQGVNIRSVCHVLWKSSRAQLSAWDFYLLATKGKSIGTPIPSLARQVLELASSWATLAYRIHGLDDVVRIVHLCWIVHQA